jgi:hypothetical protein
MNVAANGNAVGTISFPSLNPNSETAFYVGSPNNTSFNGAEYKKKTEIQQQRCSWLQRIP